MSRTWLGLWALLLLVDARGANAQDTEPPNEGAPPGTADHPPEEPPPPNSVTTAPPEYPTDPNAPALEPAALPEQPAPSSVGTQPLGTQQLGTQPLGTQPPGTQQLTVPPPVGTQQLGTQQLTVPPPSAPVDSVPPAAVNRPPLARPLARPNAPAAAAPTTVPAAPVGAVPPAGPTPPPDAPEAAPAPAVLPIATEPGERGWPWPLLIVIALSLVGVAGAVRWFRGRSRGTKEPARDESPDPPAPPRLTCNTVVAHELTLLSAPRLRFRISARAIPDNGQQSIVPPSTPAPKPEDTHDRHADRP